MAGGKSETVYRRLRGEIESMWLAPGARLSEVALAERLQASRTPVREAIRRLAREGLVAFAPGEVAEVAPISLRGVQELFEFRIVLEPAAVRMVALDGLKKPELLTEFREIAGELSELADLLGSTPDDQFGEQFYALTERFDRAIMTSCHNEPLTSTIADRRGQTARLRGIAHGDPQRMAGSLAEHRRMCEAIVGGDPETAARELSQHLAETQRAITDGLTGRRGGCDDLDLHLVPSA